MNDDTALVLRERRPMEALDSGLMLFRRFAGRLYLAFLPFYIPAAAALALFPERLFWIPFLVLWWFKPLWERLILLPLSRLFFYPDQRGRPSRRRAAFKGIAGDLSWRRFSPWRHYATPIRALEGNTGSRLRRRISLVVGSGRGIAFTLVLVMFLGEGVLLLGGTTFFRSIQMFLPHFMRIDLTWITPGIRRTLFLGYAFISGILMPMTSCMGFGLYVNRRVELEGWDLVIAFRRLRLRRASLLAVSVFLGVVAIPPDVLAADEPDPASTPLESLRNVLDDDDFGGTKERPSWRWRKGSGSDSDLFDFDGDFDFFNLSDTLAGVLHVVVVAAGAGIVGWILIRNLRLSGFGGRNRAVSSDDPSSTRQRVDELDDAVPHYREGRHREAWSVLYRYLAAFIERTGEGRPGGEYTEGEYLNLLRRTDPDSPPAGGVRGELCRIILLWRQTAYAHRLPTDEEFYRALKILGGLNLGASE